jgi:DNA-directed RNA polymerase II subunit RPB2
MGVQADEDILRLIYPDLESAEARTCIPELLASISEAVPFYDSYSAVQFIKAMTKGFSVEHVYDILFNQTFIHITDKHGGSRVHFLADCVRKFMRVHMGIDANSDRDDTRNQRCLTSGYLIRMLFNTAYTNWKKQTRLEIDREYKKNRGTYSGDKFMNIFSQGNADKLFNLKESIITESVMRGFKGKWVVGGAGGGGQMGHSDEKKGVLQAMSRLSYMDFISHTRRVILNFDAGNKEPRPRQLHTSQYGYFCTNETPSGAHIGLTKNMSLMTMISVPADPNPIGKMLIIVIKDIFFVSPI